MRAFPNQYAQVLAVVACILLGAELLHGQPANNLFANRTAVSGSSVITTGSNVGATTESNEPLHAGVTGGRSVWWTWTAPFSGRVKISTEGSDFDTLLGVYTGSSIPSLVSVAYNDDTWDYTSRVVFFVTAGVTYQIAVDGYFGEYGHVQLAIQLVQVQQSFNDMFADRRIIPGTNAVVSGNNFGGSVEPGEPDHAGVSSGYSVWWFWTAPFGGFATITTSGSDFDTVLGVYTGTTVSGLTEVASNDEAPGQTDNSSKVTFSTTAGQTYQIAVDGWFEDSGNIRLNVQLVTAQPAPAWVFPDPYGTLVNSTNFLGKVILLNFWASWCGPCKAEMPDLVALQDKYRDDGFVIIGATIWDVLQDTVNFLATNPFGINYQIIIAEPLQYDYGGIEGIPTTFIINRKNEVVNSYVGTQSGATFESQIIPLLYDNMLLASQKSGNQLVLTWPPKAVTFVLESTVSMQNPVWTQWPVDPAIVDGMNTIQIPQSPTNLFFRLRLTN